MSRHLKPSRFLRSGRRILGNILYECGICCCYHPWEFDGDCRDDLNRYGSPEEYVDIQGKKSIEIEVRTAEEREEADIAEEEK